MEVVCLFGCAVLAGLEAGLELLGPAAAALFPASTVPAAAPAASFPANRTARVLASSGNVSVEDKKISVVILAMAST